MIGDDEGKDGPMTAAEALTSIVMEGNQPGGRRIAIEGSGRLAEEADALRRSEPHSIRPEGALLALSVALGLPGVAASDRQSIEDYVSGCLARDWPENAIGLAEAVAKRLDDARRLLPLLPAELASQPRLTAAALRRLTTAPSHEPHVPSLALALRFDEAQARTLVDAWTRSPGGPLKGVVADIVERSTASEAWRQAQTACIDPAPLERVDNDAARLLDCLPMRWRARTPSFDLVAATPEVREAWCSRLVAEAKRCPDASDALLEAVLWHGSEQADELVMTAAAAICDSAADGGSRSLAALARHPSSAVTLRVAALRRRIEDHPVEPDRGGGSSVLDSARRLEVLSGRLRSSPATWIGDRRVETAIEDAARKAAARFVGSYEAHWREDEEPLTARLWDGLKASLDDAIRDLAATRGGLGAGRLVGIDLRHRMVPKSEEGARGLRPGAAFATDVCLVMTARRDRKVLASRATLIQAKKLKKDAHGRWRPSFEVDREQLRAISEQTDSSFYMLLAPEEAGRPIPMMPARLVSEHLPRGGKTRRLHRDDVARSSRPLAQWLTYDVIGLWCGDRRVSVVRKAAGEDGRRPYVLIELDVTVSSGKAA